jgi:hypothetical protein
LDAAIGGGIELNISPWTVPSIDGIETMALSLGEDASVVADLATNTPT